MRRLRRCKIIATLGPASADRARLVELLSRRRRYLPHQHEPRRPRRDARARQDDPRGREGGRTPDRHPARSAGPETADRRIQRGRRLSHQGRGVLARFRSGAGQRRTRAPAASRNPECLAARQHRAHRRRQSASAHCRSLRRQGEGHRRCPGKDFKSEGRKFARHGNPRLIDDGEGPLRPRRWPERRRRLGRGLVRAAAG